MHRLTDEELLALLDDIESARAERKESCKDNVPKKVREAICAFANDIPGHNQLGVLFIGAKDNGFPSNLQITDELLRSLADMPPVKYKGRIWIRTGSRRSIANAQEERVLNERRRYKNLPFDIYPIPTAKINDLSKVIFENEYLPQAFGRGIATARRAMTTNGNPPLEFETNQTAVVCLLRGKA